jgi:hypothetical protein
MHCCIGLEISALKDCIESLKSEFMYIRYTVLDEFSFACRVILSLFLCMCSYGLASKQSTLAASSIALQRLLQVETQQSRLLKEEVGSIYFVPYFNFYIFLSYIWIYLYLYYEGIKLAA